MKTSDEKQALSAYPPFSGSAGDYVLATKYSDGDPQDQWCVGFYDKQIENRHFVVDENGNQFRASGFRRVKKISAQRGAFILENRETIQWAVRSLWWWARCSMKQNV